MEKEIRTSKLLLAIVKITGYVPALIYYKYKVYMMNEKAQNMKLEKPTILMSNHVKLFDYVVYLMLFPFMTLRVLVSEVMFNKGKLFARFLYMLGGIRVDRDTYDFSFILRSVEALQHGERLLIFPEGRLPVGGKMSKFHPSVVLIALKSGVGITPMYVDGNYGLFKRTHVMIGETINLRDYCNTDDPSREQLLMLTELLTDRILVLRAELERRVGRGSSVYTA